ncbi:MAG TPA: Rnase Y domain-containing protein, partial [bacterium]|nr:Rnase Y domain-containing protein [bacterium]
MLYVVAFLAGVIISAIVGFVIFNGKLKISRLKFDEEVEKIRVQFEKDKETLKKTMEIEIKEKILAERNKLNEELKEQRKQQAEFEKFLNRRDEKLGKKE